MKPSPWVRMDTWLRHFVPFSITLVLLLMTAVPTRFSGFAGITPMLPLMGVYYWAIYRPDLLPPWAAFALGLLYDIVSGTPLGVNAMVLLLVQGVTVTQRRFFLAKTFLVAWWSFALLAGAATGLSWLLVSVISHHALDPAPAMVEYLVTLGLFPLLTWVLARTQMAFLKDV